MKPSALLLLLLLGLPLVVGLGDSAVWDSNEAFYVQTPREMVDSGDWIVPTFNGRLRLNKPPLSYWLVASAYRVFGVSLLVQRWVIALLALGCVGLVYLTARLTMDASEALLAAGMLATTFRFLVLSRRLLIDVAVLFCVLLALYLLLRWLSLDSRLSLVAAGAALGLGCLAKGPVAFLPLLPIGAFLLLGGDWRRLKNAPWVVAGGVCVVVASSWFWLLWWRLGWDPVADFFLTENLGRLTHMDFGPQRSIFYYAGVFSGDFFPWSILFLLALFVRVRRGLGAPVSERFDLLWLLWVGAYIAIFSFSHNKQEYYILPVYPAAALWLAPRLVQLLGRRWVRATVAVLLVLAAALLAVVAPELAGSWSLLAALLLAAAAIAAARGLPVGLVATLALAWIAAFALCLAPLDRFQPVPRIAALFEQLNSSRGHGDTARVGYYRLAVPSLRFYLDRDIDELFDPAAALAALNGSRPCYLVVGEPEYSELRASLGDRLRVEGVDVKLYTTARTLLRGLREDQARGAERPWTRPIYLVSNQGP